MDWTQEAEAAIRKVPFFVRSKVRARVEAEAVADGRHRVTIVEVKATRQRFAEVLDDEAFEALARRSAC